MNARHFSNAMGQLALFATAGFLVWLAGTHSAEPSRHCKPGCTVCARSSRTQSQALDELLGRTDSLEHPADAFALQ